MLRKRKVQKWVRDEELGMKTAEMGEESGVGWRGGLRK